MSESIFSKAVLEKPESKRSASTTFLTNEQFDSRIRMGWNENPYGMAPGALKALECAAEHSAWYENFFATDLKQELADKYDLKIQNIITGAGSSPLIQLAGEAFLNPGDEVLLCPTFAAFYDMAQTYLAKLVMVPLKEDMGYDLEGLKKAVTDHTKMIVITNPNNPTGQYIPYDTLRDFIVSLPKDIVIFIDEAYIEFATAEDCQTVMPLIREMPDRPIIVSRTFSKYYGMAGVRAGWIAAQEDLIAGIEKLPESFVSREGQAAAIAALHETEFYEESRQKIIAGARYLEAEMQKLGCKVWPTQTNFILFDPHVDCAEVKNRLYEKGIHISAPGLDRVSVSTPENNELFIRILSEVIKELKN